jgi:hypothetical protein
MVARRAAEARLRVADDLRVRVRVVDLVLAFAVLFWTDALEGEGFAVGERDCVTAADRERVPRSAFASTASAPTNAMAMMHAIATQHPFRLFTPPEFPVPWTDSSLTGQQGTEFTIMTVNVIQKGHLTVYADRGSAVEQVHGDGGG